MKIAFVGKWGSGKTTITAYFIKYLLNKKLSVLWFDADINVGLAEAIGINIKKNPISRILKSLKISEKF
jgi:CO dehydrogenase maturation factor